MINNLIEISTKKAKAGRTPAKFVLHKIYNDASEYNSNGISWSREYTEQNIESVKGMPLVCQFADDNKEIPFGGHGEMSSKDGKIVFEDSLVVGAFDKAYIDDNLEFNGEKISGLVGECYIYDQRFPNLVDYLEEQYTNELPVESSVEINADKSKGNTKIIYDGGWKEKGRIPKDYQYSGQALCIGIDPADKSALMIELNQAKKISKEGKILKKVKSTQAVEINELSYDDIATLVTRAFNSIMRPKDNYDEYCYRYWIYKFYPASNRVIMYNDYEVPYKYCMTTYEITNNSIVLGDISEVEMDWKPVNNEQEVEINTSLIKHILQKSKKEDKQTMDKDNNKDVSVVELNAQIVDKVNEINTLNKTISDKDVEINTLKEKEVELNQLIVEANKTIEAQKQQITELNTEIEPLRQLKVEKETKEKQAEINTYFETVKAENGFTEAELNTLKTEYVDKGDLDGLKSAETELCVKKVKEMKKVEKVETEVNSLNDNNLFFSTKVETVETNTSNDGSELFR